MSIRVFIVDDHRILREGLRELLERQPGIRVIGEAEDGEIALKLVNETLPDVAVMDILMPNLNGMEATRQIITQAPDTKVIALSMYSNRQFIIGMLSTGASAYLPKDCSFEEFGKTIRVVAEGKTYLGSTIVDTVVRDYFNCLQTTDDLSLNTLTIRERQILQLIVEGRSVKDIALHLSLSVKTTETYRQKVMNKLNIHSIPELTKYAIREGLTSLEK